MAERARPQLSSLPLQILFYFDYYYTLVFVVYNLLLFVYKGSSFYYPPYTIWLEVTVTLMLVVIQSTRIFLGSKSNKTEMMRPMIWSLLLTPAAATAFSYFLALQLYVLRLDIIMNALGLVFLGLELPLQLVAAFNFSAAVYM
ncbi:hypothetical protein CTAYLR_007076 [Chrysophaeum taylorii]|uniref:Uncharacterized protein n=1 Tax=Chrysophaeum taylorii TaxID=2483200 RepID=A0AAD7ULW0_9STRA|nr:hypothetical protein CTAYLR_007076 [Chrysophaeum taylorii]